MARIRTIKPEALQHRKVGRLCDRAFRLWITMLTQADDHGRGFADPGQLRLLAFGYFPEVTEKDVAAALDEIAGTGLIRLYEAATAAYYCFPDWNDHQKISHPGKAKLPPPPELQSSPESSGALQILPQGSKDQGSIDQGSKDWKSLLNGS